jgi:hypothetical protein
MKTTPNRIFVRWFHSDLGDRSSSVNAAVVESPAAVALALRLLEAHPLQPVELFERNWVAVDIRRFQLGLAGLANRVGVHHVCALMCTSVRAALAASKSIVLFPQ